MVWVGVPGPYLHLKSGLLIRVRKIVKGARETAQRLRTLAAFPGDLDLIPTTYRAAHSQL